jgi:hypothetical protein
MAKIVGYKNNGLLVNLDNIDVIVKSDNATIDFRRYTDRGLINIVSWGFKDVYEREEIYQKLVDDHVTIYNVEPPKIPENQIYV